MAARRRRSRPVLLSAYLLSGSLISWLRLGMPELGLTKAIAAGAAPQDAVKPEKEAELEGRVPYESPGALPLSEGDTSGRGGEIPQKINDASPRPQLGFEQTMPFAFAGKPLDREGFAALWAKLWPDNNPCDPWKNHLIAHRHQRAWKYDMMHSPAVRQFFLRVFEDGLARCPPAHEKAKIMNGIRFFYTTASFFYLLFAADLLLHGKVVLTPEEVARYAFVQPKDRDVSDHLRGDFVGETKQLMVEKLGMAEADADARIEDYKKHNSPMILRGQQLMQTGTHFEEWDDEPARDGDLEKLRANDPEVDRQLRHYEDFAQKVLRHRLRTAGPSPTPINASATPSEAVPILGRDHFYLLFFERTEAEIVYILEKLEAFDEVLPSDLLPPTEEAETWTRAATATPTTARRLPAKVSNRPVDWRPKARATIEIPYAAYPVVPSAARQRHWMTGFGWPLVTGRDAETKKPIVQFLRLVNTRASRKTQLVPLLLHNLRAVLSKQNFERIVDPEARPYLKWFLTVKHPRGAPDEYLQELRDLDDWRKGFVWACGSVAVLLLLLGLAGGVWVVRLFRKNEAIRRKMWARRKSREVASTAGAPIGSTELGNALAPSTADAETVTFGQRGRSTSGDLVVPRPSISIPMTEPEASTPIFGRRAPPNTSVSSMAEPPGPEASTSISGGRRAPPNTLVSSISIAEPPEASSTSIHLIVRTRSDGDGVLGIF